MSRLNEENLRMARQIISMYPKKKSAMIPLLHLAQEQSGLVSNEAMTHIAELIEVTPAEVLGSKKTGLPVGHIHQFEGQMFGQPPGLGRTVWSWRAR